MENVHDVVLTTIYARMRADRAQLETEESGKIIARLQGKITRYNLLLEQMKENIPFLSFVDNEDDEPNIHDMEDRDLVVLSMGLLTDRAYWNPIEKFMKYEVAQDKHNLYYHVNKPRSLDVIHGKRDGMLLFKDIFAEVKHEIESRREEEPLFKEELEDENMDLSLFDFEADPAPSEAEADPKAEEETEAPQVRDFPGDYIPADDEGVDNNFTLPEDADTGRPDVEGEERPPSDEEYEPMPDDPSEDEPQEPYEPDHSLYESEGENGEGSID